MAFLAGLDIHTDMDRHPLRGALFETFVVQNVCSLVSALRPDARFFHYRSHTGHEVDLVVEMAGSVAGIEIKAGASVDARDLKGLRALLENEPRCAMGMVAYQGAEPKWLGDRLAAVPVGRLIG